jgi:hypothetical protein
MDLQVDTRRVRELSVAVGRSHAEAVAMLRSPELLGGSLAAMAAEPAGGLELHTAGAAFMESWGQALQDAARELGWLSSALDAAAGLYEAVEAGAANVSHGRVGVVLR